MSDDFKFRIDGVDYTYNPGLITPAMSRIYRKFAGVSLMGVISGVDDGDIAAIAALVWASRWQSGEKIHPAKLDEQFATMNALNEMEVEFLDNAVPVLDEASDPELLPAASD